MLGAIGIVLGVLALVIPLFGALGSCVPFVDAACNDACTPCTDEEKKVSCHLFCGDLGGIWGESSLVVALANLRLGGQSLPKLSSLKVAGTDAACNSATLDCRQPGNGIEMYCSNGTLGIDSKLKTSIRLVAASQIWASACQTLGIIFVYLVVFGWAACVLGVVGASLACCVCCQCCKAKLDDPWVKQGAPPVVVGTAAPA